MRTGGFFLNEFDRYDETDNYEQETNIEQTKKKHNKKFSVGSQMLVVIQLILCGLVLICAVAIKSIGGSLYATISTWFYDNYNNSVFTDTKDNILSFVDNTKTTEKNSAVPNTDNSSENTDITEKIKSDMKLPLQSGTITSGFGNRDDESGSEFHKGIDIAAEKDSEIYSMLDGTVTIAEEDSSYGNYIVITHSDNVKTLYAHCSELCVKQGDTVTAGQKIALVGSTGDADGVHLHLEIIIDNENTNPQDILGKEYT